jgi:hypothetical protein
LRLPHGRRIVALADFVGTFAAEPEMLWGCIGRCDVRRFFEACLVYFARFCAEGDGSSPFRARLFRAFGVVRGLLERKILDEHRDLQHDFAAFLARG